MSVSMKDRMHTIAWFTGYRRLTIRYERQLDHFLAYRQLLAAITRHKKLDYEGSSTLTGQST
jgi:hypothetical protein